MYIFSLLVNLYILYFCAGKVFALSIFSTKTSSKTSVSSQSGLSVRLKMGMQHSHNPKG